MVLEAGVMRAIHVLTPALVNRLKNGGKEPLMAVRSSADDYGSLQLFQRVTWNGRSEIAESFDAPMPGTSGRGVAVVYTAAKLICYYDKVAPLVKSPADASIEEVYKACQQAMAEWKEQLVKTFTPEDKAWNLHLEKRKQLTEKKTIEEAVVAESSFKALTEVVDKVDALEAEVKAAVKRNDDTIRENNTLKGQVAALQFNLEKMKRRERQLVRDLEIRRLDELRKVGNVHAAEALTNLIKSRDRDPEATEGAGDLDTHTWLVAMARKK